MPAPPSPADRPDPSPEDPTRFPEQPGVAPLDEAPDGHTPMEPTGSGDDGSLPPGAPRRDEDDDEG